MEKFPYVEPIPVLRTPQRRSKLLISGWKGSKPKRGTELRTYLEHMFGACFWVIPLVSYSYYSIKQTLVYGISQIS